MFRRKHHRIRFAKAAGEHDLAQKIRSSNLSAGPEPGRSLIDARPVVISLGVGHSIF